MAPGSHIVITGANGFLGWHLRCRLRALCPQAHVRLADRSAFASQDLLASLLTGADTVIHLAGANRGSDEDLYETNVGLADRLVDALEAADSCAHVIYAGSTHAGSDTAYGRSKERAGSVLAAWGDRVGAQVRELRLPNLFGECGKPDYNSAVATFCRDLAYGRPSDVNPDGWTELLHAQDASALLVDEVRARSGGVCRVEGQRVAIPEVYGRLQHFAATYQAAEVPPLNDQLGVRLFNTLRTAMFPHRYPITLEEHRDTRGAFVEVARGHGRTQASFSTTLPTVTRGEHYHLDKIERFVVLSGSAVIRVRRLLSDDVIAYKVSGDEPVAVDMPPLHVHDITNVGDDDLLTVFWANDHFDPARPDTYPEGVDTIAGAGARS